ncbi:MAG TPA: OsmC family protein [Actinomycetales bacterium]|nr:OsmC family protein [Actinomycetales bacterium]
MTTLLHQLAHPAPDLSESRPLLSHIHVAGDWTGDLGSDLSVRTFDFSAAGPSSHGGDRSAPTPFDYLVGALLSSVISVTELVARERGIELHSVREVGVGTVDLRGLNGAPGVSPHFQHVGATIWVKAFTEVRSFREVVAEVERRCPVYSLFRDAGVEPSLTWILNGSKL